MAEAAPGHPTEAIPATQEIESQTVDDKADKAVDKPVTRSGLQTFLLMGALCVSWYAL
jgi:hypothetical protein